MKSQGAVFAEWLLLTLNPMAVLSVSTEGRDEAVAEGVGREGDAFRRVNGGFAGISSSTQATCLFRRRRREAMWPVSGQRVSKIKACVVASGLK